MVGRRFAHTAAMLGMEAGGISAKPTREHYRSKCNPLLFEYKVSPSSTGSTLHYITVSSLYSSVQIDNNVDGRHQNLGRNENNNCDWLAKCASNRQELHSNTVLTNPFQLLAVAVA